MSHPHLAAAAAFALALGATASAQPATTSPVPGPSTAPVGPPTAEAIQAFWRYYFHGKGGGPLLAEAKVCLEVAKDGDHKHECLREVPSTGVKTGTPVYVWQAFVVPQGEDRTTLTVQVKHNDVVRETKDFEVKGESVRSRHWTTVRLPKPGVWTFVLLRGKEPYRTLVVEAN